MNTLPARLSWGDIVRQEMDQPVLTPELIDHILWGETAFPFGDVETVRRQIREFREKWMLRP